METKPDKMPQGMTTVMDVIELHVWLEHVRARRVTLSVQEVRGLIPLVAKARGIMRRMEIGIWMSALGAVTRTEFMNELQTGELVVALEMAYTQAGKDGENPPVT